MRTRVLDRWAAAVWFDFALAAVVGGAVGWRAPIGDLIAVSASRASAYSGAAALVGVLGALATVALNVYGSGTGRRLRQVRQLDERGDMRRNFTAAFVVPPLSALACWSAQVLEFASRPQPAVGLCVAAILLSIMTFTRQTWLFRHLMRLADQDAAEARTSPRPAAEAARTRESLTPIASVGERERSPMAL